MTRETRKRVVTIVGILWMPICFGLMAAQFGRFVFGPETLHTGKAGVHE